MTAGLAAGLARGLTWDEAARLGAAAGSLNVTRRGLATGDLREIERLADHIELRVLERDGTSESPARAEEGMSDTEQIANVSPGELSTRTAPTGQRPGGPGALAPLPRHQ